MSTIETESAPFAGGGLTWHEPTVMEDFAAATFRLTSPFAGGVTGEDESESAYSDVEALIGELEDEGFREDVESLVDEVAGRHLEAMSRWPDAQEAESAAAAEASAWMESFADAVDTQLAELEARYDSRRIDSFSENEAEALFAEFSRDPDSASEQFLGGLIKKAVSVAKSVAKGAVSGLTRLIPMGPIFGVLRKLVGPLLKRVLAKAINRLPASLRAPATQLATKFGLGEHEANAAEDLSEEFDTEFATLLLAPTDAAASEMLFEIEQDFVPTREDPIAALDRARSTLARQLAEAEPGKPPTEQLEQFIPVVMAAMPLIRAGLKLTGGRDRIKRFLASRLATMIQGYVGQQAARALAPHIADTGLRLLSLESESPEQLGAEALVSTLEDAITQVMAMPAESLDDPLRLEAEAQDALETAALHYLPQELLRDDLENYETAGGTGPWVAMPRTGGARRYRKSARRFDVTITRPLASAVELPDADTLEERLLDAGVSSWPVAAEVQLFESMIGTHLGHLAVGEGEDVSVTEFEELSPVNAALLLGRPALGSKAGIAAPGARRFFRLVVPGRKVVRRTSRIYLRLRAQQPQPELRVHVRLGERLAHQVATLGARNAQPELVALLRRILGPRLQESVATRLSRMLGRATKATVPPNRGQQLATHLVEAIKAEFAKQLPTKSEAVSAAAKDPAPGLTLTFAFPFADAAALTGGQPGTPTMTVRPGTQND